jgi:hypothetical protein
MFLCLHLWATLNEFQFYLSCASQIARYLGNCWVRQARNWSHLLGAFEKLRKATISFVLSLCRCVCPSAWNNSAPTGWIFMKFDTWVFFGSLSRRFGFYYNITRITGPLREDQCRFMIMRYVADKSCRENQNTHFVCSNFFSRKPCRLWDNVEKIWSNRTGHRWQYNTAHAHCALDNCRYRHTQNMWILMLLSGSIGYANKRNRNAGTGEQGGRGGGGEGCCRGFLTGGRKLQSVRQHRALFTSWAITVWYPVCTFALPPSLYWLRDLLVLGVERPGREIDCSLLRNAVSFTSAHSRIYYMTCYWIVHFGK